MSLFKAREWWTTVVGENELFDSGCLCVADLLNRGSDQVIVGSFHRHLSIFQPALDTGKGFTIEDIVLETQLADPILQVDVGRFVSGSSALHLAVLHPRKLAVFNLSAKEGVAEHGIQYQLRCAYEHKLQRTSFNFCYGPFGGVKDRDFICIQSMDGTVSIFEQETFSFSRFLPGALLPGPIRYVRTIDSFVTVMSSCQVDCFKFQKLARASDEKEESQSMTKGKRVAADWTFLINELGLDIVVTKYSSCPLTIFVLGERNLYALSETGQLLFMKKFDYNPSCFLPYYSGKNDSIHCMIATHSQTLLVYENITLKWASQLSFIPVQIKVANIQGLQGVIVALDEQGHLSCFYLGTDPSIVNHPAVNSRAVDYNKAEAELQQLQTIIKEQHKASAPALPMSSSSSALDDDLKVKVSVSSSLDKSSEAVDVEIKDDMPIPSVTATIQVQAKYAVSNVKLACCVTIPIVASEPVITIPSVVPGQPTEVRVSFFMKHRMLPTDLKLVVLATYYTTTGAPRIVQARARLPLALVIRPCQPVKNATYKLTIDTNKSTVHLGEMFSDLWGSNTESAASAVGFKYYGLDPVITLLAAKSSQRYRVQCDSFGYMWHLTNELITRLGGHFKIGANSDFKLSYESTLPLQEYFEVIDKHFECQQQAETLAKTLEENASQFRALQKRLLIMFKDKTPTSMKNLDSLLDYTYNQILSVADAVASNKEQHVMLSAELSCATCTVNSLIRIKFNLSADDFRVLESVLSPVVHESLSQSWEQRVDAAVTHVLRTTLSKNAKDVSLNPTPLSSLKDVHNVKKYIAVMCERLSKGAKLSEDTSSVTQQHKSFRNKIDTDQTSPAIFDYRSLLAAKTSSSSNGQVSAYSKEKISRPVAGGEPAYSNDWSSASSGTDDISSGKDFRKKKKAPRASDNVPDLDTFNQNDDDGRAMKLRSDEIVYGVD